MKNVEDWINNLKESSKLILVEGKKDKKNLNLLGLNEIITVANRPAYKILEEIEKRNAKEIVILTDLDSEGRKLYSKLKSMSQKNGIKVDRKFREFLFSSTSFSHIEGIKV